MPHKMNVAAAVTLTGDRTLSAMEVRSYAFWSFDPGGEARAVTLPAAADTAGQLLWITNTADAAEALTVEADEADIKVLSEGDSCHLWSDGVAWRSTPIIYVPEA